MLKYKQTLLHKIFQDVQYTSLDAGDKVFFIGDSTVWKKKYIYNNASFEGLNIRALPIGLDSLQY